MAFFVTHVCSEAQGGIRATLPDFNLYVFAHAICDVPEQLQNALIEHYRGPVPKSSEIEDWQGDGYQSGWWLWLNVVVDSLVSRGKRRRKLMRVPTDLDAPS